MIGHLVLFAKENTNSSKSILCYTLTSTTYLAIGKTESALLVLLQNLRTNEAGSRPYFWGFLPTSQTRLAISSLHHNTSGLLKGSYAVLEIYSKFYFRCIALWVAATKPKNQRKRFPSVNALAIF